MYLIYTDMTSITLDNLKLSESLISQRQQTDYTYLYVPQRPLYLIKAYVTKPTATQREETAETNKGLNVNQDHKKFDAISLFRAKKGLDENLRARLAVSK